MLIILYNLYIVNKYIAIIFYIINEFSIFPIYNYL